MASKHPKPDFEKAGGLVPAIVQDVRTGKVLMLGYMNEKAFKKTRKEGLVTFFSRSKQRLWTKGETSGHYLHVDEIRIDCDQDAVLIKARPDGPTCHTGADTCFSEINHPPQELDFLHRLSAIIHERRVHPDENSYTSKLFHKGINRIAKKVGEEAVEVVIEAKDEDRNLFLNECADLLFHFLVLLEAKEARFSEVLDVLEERNRK
ncbi:MAG: bifunctional phosphoribosyl-AMP cyclohydrolase/phosphoribosyl-ATP diphosphatase HisIE [Bacteroidia bacterium]|nr:bifunctional phosphoribosyl-AMP cyclohydrolase/phosphoribosyl-ATP diphosphatase HisIE [Bacteroidia bacterium]